MEKQAADAERASVRYKQAEYLRDRIGEEFDGRVTGLTAWGVYVELAGTGCEGMVALRALQGDVFRFDQEHFTVVGHRTRRRIGLGDVLRVVVKAVDMDRRTVDLAEALPRGPVTTSGKFRRKR
jgi:ribonuclease R